LREATLEIPTNQPNAVHARRLRPALSLVDYLLIAATALTFLVIAAVNLSHTGAYHQARSTSTYLPGQTSQLSSDPSLIRARLGFARMAKD
jgi:hypothetical protein